MRAGGGCVSIADTPDGADVMQVTLPGQMPGGRRFPGESGSEAADVAGCRGGWRRQRLISSCWAASLDSREFLELLEVADGGVAVGELLPELVVVRS